MNHRSRPYQSSTEARQRLVDYGHSDFREAYYWIKHNKTNRKDVSCTNQTTNYGYKLMNQNYAIRFIQKLYAISNVSGQSTRSKYE